MAESFATIADIEAIWRPLTADEESRAGTILPLISDSLRIEATNAGRDLDEMVTESATYGNVVKSVTVDIAVRYLKQSTTESGPPVAQESQSALGYSWSATYAIPGGGLPIMRNDLKRLGLKRQRYGVIEFYGHD